MLTWMNILAQEGGMEQFGWIIAVLVLSAVGGIVEKIKQKKGESDKPTPTKPVFRIPPPDIPAERKARPARPVTRENREQSPRAPSRGHPPTVPPARHAAPPARHAAPPARRAAPPARHVAPPAPKPMAVPQVRRVEEAKPVHQMRKHGEAPSRRTAAAASKAQARQEQRKLERRPPRPTVYGLCSEQFSFSSLSIKDLRRAVVLNEVLQTPLGLRESPPGMV